MARLEFILRFAVFIRHSQNMQRHDAIGKYTPDDGRHWVETSIL